MSNVLIHTNRNIKFQYLISFEKVKLLSRNAFRANETKCEIVADISAFNTSYEQIPLRCIDSYL